VPSLAELGFGRAVAVATGRPGYHPGDMLRLYIWGYLNQVRSSRHLERACVRDLEAGGAPRRGRRGKAAVAMPGNFRSKISFTSTGAFPLRPFGPPPPPRMTGEARVRALRRGTSCDAPAFVIGRYFRDLGKIVYPLNGAYLFPSGIVSI
jgi:hypothetical protein